MADVTMPRLSDSMEEGTIIRWLKATGDTVVRGDEIVEIETDKATMTYEADADGTVEIVAGEGETVAVGALIARIGGAPAATPEAAPVVNECSGDTVTEVAIPAAAEPRPRADGRVAVSPLARRIAVELSVDLNALGGTGPGGRIVRADVERAAQAERSAALTPPAPVPAAAEPDTTTAKGGVTVINPTRMQQVIARRMSESKATIPEFSITTRVDMDACVALRAQLKAMQSGSAPSFNDMVVKACALALREFPLANSSYRDGAFQLFSRVNIGIAVATEGALVVPTIFDADRKSLGGISEETHRLADRVRSGEVSPNELSGGTFTVSNLGMYGISTFQAVINQRQAAILAVGELSKQPVVVGDSIAIGTRMEMTLVCDHRILYGADAATFLARIRQLLETPLSMAL